MTEEKNKDSSKKKNIQWEPKKTVMTIVQKNDRTSWEPKKTAMRTVELAEGQENRKIVKKAEEKKQ